MGEPVPLGYQGYQPPELANRGRHDRYQHSPAEKDHGNQDAAQESYNRGAGADVPFAEQPIFTTTTLPPSTPPRANSNLEQEKRSDLESGNGDSTVHHNQAEIQPDGPDVNIVWWDGPNDPQNPLNWSEPLKWTNVAVISLITFVTYVPNRSLYPDECSLSPYRGSPLASSMFAPGIPEVMSDFNSHNAQLGSLVVSIYVLGYAFGPLLIAPLSEMYGRLVMYHTCNVLFVVLTIACAVSSNFNMLIGFRFVAGIFGSCPLTIGGGTIADIVVQEKRGGVLAVWALGPLMGPVIGPVVGGYVTQSLGWRWIFWILTILVSIA